MLNTARYMTPQNASAALLMGGAMWGIYWVPIRWLGAQGLSATWAGIVLFAASLILLAPLCWRDRKTIALEWRRLLIGGAFTGAAFGLYTVSLFHTDVVRSILLFYLTPIWGTLLGLIFLGERLGLNKVIALALGVLGLCVVLGDGLSLPWPKNLGDTLALLSGITWALGTLGLYKAGQTGVTSQIMAFLGGAFAVTFFAALLMSDAIFTQADATWGIALLGSAALFGLFTIPMTWLTVWPTTYLTPARVGLLLMSEIVVGLISAALFSGEPFGWREMIGAFCIVAAALSELSSTSTTPRPDARA